MSKKQKKKRIKDRLAKKRGRKKPKKKIPPPQSKKQTDPQVLNNMMLATIPLSELEEMRDIEFDKEKLDTYLESEKKASEKKPLDFIREGVKIVLTPEILQTVQERFLEIVQKRNPPEHVAVSIDAYFRLLSMGISPEFIPMFFFIFARQVKNHPLSDDPKIWKYIVDFLPKKVVSPDEKQTLLLPGAEKRDTPEEKKEEEKRDERYPHIILPK
jgi:hypothetical protein